MEKDKPIENNGIALAVVLGLDFYLALVEHYYGTVSQQRYLHGKRVVIVVPVVKPPRIKRVPTPKVPGPGRAGRHAGGMNARTKELLPRILAMEAAGARRREITRELGPRSDTLVRLLGPAKRKKV